MQHLFKRSFLTLLLVCSSLAHGNPAEWTLMVYIAGDNDLEGPALVDLDEMEAGLPETGVNVIVLIDRSKDYSEELGDWHDTRILQIQPNKDRGTVDLRELVRIGEVNTGDPQTLTDFMKYSMNNFPARRFGLVMWNHGGGWQAMASDDDLGNGDGHDSLTTVELSQALSQALPPGKKLDLIGFDMCLMAQLEVAYEMAPFADFMVASQAIEPGYGWPYHVLLPEFGNVNSTPRALASNIVQRYGAYAENENELIATQSAIDLGQIPRVVKNLDALSSNLARNAPRLWPALSRSMFWADSFEVSGKTENLERGVDATASSDLLDIVKRMRQSLGRAFPAEQEFRGLLDAMDSAVVDQYTSHRHRLSHGLAIYAPPMGKNFNKDYLQLRMGKQSQWPSLLYTLHQQQANASRPVNIKGIRYVKAGTMEQVTNSSMLDNTTLKLEVEGDNILWVEGMVGRYMAEQKGHLVYSLSYLTDSRFMAERLAASGSTAELLMPEFKGGSARMEMEVAPATFAISNGEYAAFATLDSRQAQSGAGTTVSIRALYKSATEGEHIAVISFDLLTWQAVGIALLVEQEDGSISPRGVKPKPEDTVTLLYEFMPDAGGSEWVKGQKLTWNDGLELIMDEVPNGTYRTWAQVETLSGESALGYAEVNVTNARQDIRGGLDAAKNLSITDLAGIWSAEGQDIFGIGEPLKSSPDSAQAIVNAELLPEAAKDYLFVARLDNALLPTLQLITFAADGKTILGREVFMLLANPNKPDSLFIKSLIGGAGNAVGEIIEVSRTQHLTPPQPGPVPDPQPQPQSDSLVGAWEGQGPYGYIYVEFSPQGEYYQVDTPFDNSMRVEVRGAYALQGNVMQLQAMQAQRCNAFGCEGFYPQQVPPFPFELSGDMLRTEISTLYRVSN
ncbi:MAG: clostripain-related cysteine peptidase [Pseudomonadaceae bacterium]|nr:clostripain-related cysteine peptidase [Pseudomonadaceae bacterium]